MTMLHIYYEWLRTAYTHPDTPISPDSLRRLVREYGSEAADWRQLGLHLGVPNDKLREIQANHAGHPSQCQLCLTDMFDWWLKNTPNPINGQVYEAVHKGKFRGSYVSLRNVHLPKIQHYMPPETITFFSKPCIISQWEAPHTGARLVETESETDEPSQPQVEKKSGLRKIWSTFQRCTADFVKSALGKLSGLFASLDVHRKYKKSKDVVRWWYEVEGDESKLQALEGEWAVIQASTQWKLE